MKDNRTCRELLDVIRQNFLQYHGPEYTEVLVRRYTNQRKKTLLNLADFIENRKPALLAAIQLEMSI